MRRALLVAAALWVGRWALLELAALAGHVLPRRPPPTELPGRPGWMPGPFPSDE